MEAQNGESSWGTKTVATSQYDWDKLERRARSAMRLCLSYSMLLNVCGEDSAIKLYLKLGSLYQSKSLVNKLFHLKMDENDTVTERLNVYNTLVS